MHQRTVWIILALLLAPAAAILAADDGEVVDRARELRLKGRYSDALVAVGRAENAADPAVAAEHAELLIETGKYAAADRVAAAAGDDARCRTLPLVCATSAGCQVTCTWSHLWVILSCVVTPLLFRPGRHGRKDRAPGVTAGVRFFCVPLPGQPGHPPNDVASASRGIAVDAGRPRWGSDAFWAASEPLHGLQRWACRALSK